MNQFHEILKKMIHVALSRNLFKDFVKLLLKNRGTNQLQNFGTTKIPVFRANLSCMVEVKKNLLTVAGCHP